VRELLVGVRPIQAGLPTVRAEALALPVLGQYDVVVVGGGTGGAPAAIGAARRGAKTLLLEYLHGLGGVGTLGLITKYYHGNRVGFTTELDQGVAAIGAPAPVGKMEWYRREVRKAGGDIWFGCLGCGALVEGGQVKGVVVATPHGRGAVLARAVVDATGNADIAIAAGAAYEFVGPDDPALQGVGLPPRNLGAGYTNTDYAFVDETDMLDVWHMFVTARQRSGGAWDLGQLIDTRERRRIVGDVMLSPLDIVNARTWPDTVVIAKSNFDTHGFTVHPLFFLKAPDRAGLVCRMPYRCLLPKGLDGILVTGLGVSAHRDAIPIVRMQPDIQNQGYAAGVAAAMVAPSAGSVRALDIRGLQTHLVEKGILPEETLHEEDSYPLPAEAVAAAVERAGAAADHAALAVILAQPKDSLPLLRTAYAAAQGQARLAYAHILAMMGDPAGAETLLAAVGPAAWDKGWNFRGMGQYGMSVSPLDALIIALGRTRDPKAVPVLLEKLGQLPDAPDFSHCRALAMAFEAIGSPSAAKPLADLLARRGMGGHAVRAGAGAAPPRGDRNSALRELVLARALYRCGDHQGVGEKVLRAYAADPQGLYARHAQAVLDARSSSARPAPGNESPGPAGAAGPTANPQAMRRVHVFVRGDVQGVGFRLFTQESGSDLGLAGWVKNLADGRVEAVIEGDPAAVAALLDRLKRGPPAAQVQGLDVRDEPPAGDLRGFAVRF
jgi:acylphosphatase